MSANYRIILARRLGADPAGEWAPRSTCDCPLSLDHRSCHHMAGLKEGRMRAQTSLISILAAGGAIAFLLAGWNGGLAAPTPAAVFADRSPNAIPVDTELVIAVDVSNSMDPEEQELQREGYIAGLTSREFLQALRSGALGKVAVTY